MDQYALVIFAAGETATGLALDAQFESELQGLPPLPAHACSLLSLGYCADSLASIRQCCVQMPDPVVAIFDSSGNLPPNLGTEGQEGPCSHPHLVPLLKPALFCLH